VPLNWQSSTWHDQPLNASKLKEVIPDKRQGGAGAAEEQGFDGTEHKRLDGVQ
jgi:hypothetical protein